MSTNSAYTKQKGKQYYPDVDVELTQSFAKQDWEAALESIAGYPRGLYGIKQPVDLETALAYILFDAPNIKVGAKTGRMARGHTDDHDPNWLKQIFLDCRTEKPLGE